MMLFNGVKVVLEEEEVEQVADQVLQPLLVLHVKLLVPLVRRLSFP